MKYVLCLLLICSALPVFSRKYRTDSFDEKIKSLQVQRVNDWQASPIIRLGGREQIEIKFDEMSHEYKQFTYTITHCNADWVPSQLTPVEFMQGFQNLQLDDYLFSFNTTMPYTNYRLVLPNNDVRFKVSGNYAVDIFDSENPDRPVLCACFSVVESSSLSINAQVSTATDIDFNKAHQQISFSLNCRDYKIISPQQELKVFVMQNNRINNMTGELQPSSILNGIYTYQHNKNLIFEAGNEYRRFEMTTTAYKGIGIEGLDFHAPYYHVTLFQDKFRSYRPYVYDSDQNGRYLVRCVDGENYDSESDYFFVHFSLDAPEPLPGKVYIQSEAFYNILDSRSQMTYSPAEKAYTKTALLKQGAYNYMYLFRKDGNSPATTAAIEGNFYQTENEYLILVYHRPWGERYDRLVGVEKLKIEN